ncbi:MAG TPA: hypothetical protein VHL77_08035 [Ferruginibacter sp.]|jgi:hypothetical protein|nr:hypothetical protein [Ferruginibacter sp.]
MVTLVKCLLSAVLVCILTSAIAQKPKPAAAKPVAVQKFKPPKLTCVLGSYADSATVFAEEAAQLVNLPLRITDDKKIAYVISSYQVMYKRKAVTENEETGKVSPIMSPVADIFKQTPLPPLWRKILSEQLKPGEEIYFFDIVVKDTQGHLMFAPDLRLKIK